MDKIVPVLCPHASSPALKTAGVRGKTPPSPNEAPPPHLLPGTSRQHPKDCGICIKDRVLEDPKEEQGRYGVHMAAPEQRRDGGRRGQQLPNPFLSATGKREGLLHPASAPPDGVMGRTALVQPTSEQVRGQATPLSCYRKGRKTLPS